MKLTVLLSMMLLSASSMCAQKMFSVDSQYQADVKVFIVDKEYRADLIVFKTDKQYRAKADENKGIYANISA